MNQNVEDAVFDGKNYSRAPLPIGRYESCTFRNCVFLNSSISQIQFVDCSFIDCDLSNIKTYDTAFKNVDFKGSKLIGVQFDRAHEFMLSLHFDECIMNLCSFNGMALKKTTFIKCMLLEVDFREADLAEAQFEDCNLLQALFENSNLFKADFRTAFHFSIDPTKNSILKARFSREGIVGLLDQLDIIID